MSHEILIGQHPDLVILRYHGNIEADDIITNPDDLHLNDGRLKYLLADTSDSNPVVPEGMWERVHNSIISHQNLVHIAIVAKSGMLKVLLNAVIKLTRQGKRVSLHNSFEEAESHLLGLIQVEKA